MSVVDGSKINLNGGVIEVSDGGDDTLEIDNGRVKYSDGAYVTYQSPITTGVYAASPQPIIYSTGKSRIIYQNGAVIRVDAGNAILKQEPSMRFAEDGTLVQLIETRPATGENPGNVGGTTTALVRTERDKTILLTPLRQEPPYLVSLTIQTTPDRAEVWQKYFESQIKWTNTGTETEPCRVDGDMVYCAFLIKGQLDVVKTGVATTIS
jgi:hypothetical protein